MDWSQKSLYMKSWEVKKLQVKETGCGSWVCPENPPSQRRPRAVGTWQRRVCGCCRPLPWSTSLPPVPSDRRTDARRSRCAAFSLSPWEDTASVCLFCGPPTFAESRAELHPCVQQAHNKEQGSHGQARLQPWNRRRCGNETLQRLVRPEGGGFIAILPQAILIHFVSGHLYTYHTFHAP